MNATQPDYPGRRFRARERLEADVLVVSALPVRYKSGDTEYEYRPDSDLLYLAGVTDPGAVLVLGGSQSDLGCVLFLPAADPRVALWSGPRVAPEEAAAVYGVDQAFPRAQLAERLPALLAGIERAFVRRGVDPEVDRWLNAALERGRARRRREGQGLVGVLDPSLVLDDLRLIKDAWERDRIRDACAVSVEGHRAAFGTVAPDRGEWEVEAALEAAFRTRRAFGPAFPSIVGSGPNACVLHYTDNDRVMRAGELVLIDAGAEVRHYSGDITRTLPVSGRFTAAQREVYGIVETARGRAVDAVRPGAGMDEPHRVAVATMVEGLVSMGVLQGTLEEVLSARAHEPFMPHKTSHWLGLDVHDVGSYQEGARPRTLEPGMVLTVEPGLYFPPGAAGLPDGLAGTGIRIEDDVLVTAEGRENLTEALPTDPDAVEALMADLRERA